MLVKAALNRHFSIIVFGWSQILIDLQPLYVILFKRGHLHGFTHTFIGATLLALVAAITGKYLADFGLCLLNWHAFVPVRWPTALLSACIGTYSHVLLDGLMHPDLEPFAPFSAQRPWLGWISISELHLLCILTFFIGMAWMAWRHLRDAAPLDKPPQNDKA
jgi:membrane-bound metal-dependent hydrolase YbcI (DUF457 family)